MQKNATRDRAHQVSKSSSAVSAKLIGPKTIAVRKQAVGSLNSGVKTKAGSC